MTSAREANVAGPAQPTMMDAAYIGGGAGNVGHAAVGFAAGAGARVIASSWAGDAARVRAVVATFTAGEDHCRS